MQVNINACLTGVATAGTESDTTVTAEQKWKSSNVKAVVTNGKSIGENSKLNYAFKSKANRIPSFFLSTVGFYLIPARSLKLGTHSALQ